MAAAVAVRGDDGRYAILGGKGANFEVENWLRADADPRPPDAADLHAGVRCDPLGCLGQLKGGRLVALSARPEVLAEDCEAAAVVISRYAAPRGCSATALVIDGPALDRFGAHAVTIEGDNLWVTTAYPAIRRPFMPPARE